MRVILADQRTSMLAYCRNYFADVGYDVSIAKDGVECLGLLRNSVPDVLVLAANLFWGGTDGILDVMMQSPKMKDVPVLLLLDYRSESKICRHPMVVSILRRPFQLHDLEKYVVFLHKVKKNCKTESGRLFLPMGESQVGRNRFLLGRV